MVIKGCGDASAPAAHASFGIKFTNYILREKKGIPS
jgi:hypothetical protein